MHFIRDGQVRHSYVELEKAGEWLGRPIVSVETAIQMSVTHFERPAQEPETIRDIFRFLLRRPQTAKKSVVRIPTDLFDLAVDFQDLTVRAVSYTHLTLPTIYSV